MKHLSFIKSNKVPLFSINQLILCIAIFFISNEMLQGQKYKDLESLQEYYSSKQITFEVSDYHCDSSINICYYYLQQLHQNIPIQSYISVASQSDKKDSIFFKENLAKYKFVHSNKSKNDHIDDQRAVSLALLGFGISKKVKLKEIPLKSGRNRTYQNLDISSEIIKVDEVYIVKNGGLKLCKQVSLFIDEKNEWWEVRIDPATQKIIEQNTWTIECNHKQPHLHKDPYEHYSGEVYIDNVTDNSYVVYGMPLKSPDEGSRTEIASPWLIQGQSVLPSPYGWHDTDGTEGAESTLTFGNNVFAYPDRNADNQPDSILIPDGGSNLSFNFPINLSESPNTYVAAATTNLFYWNNIIHDVMYNYGFTEAAGNFQLNNYDKGGQANDHVKAESQDGSGLNNANFSAPPDGFNPRMQMYEWGVPKQANLTINNQNSYAVRPGSFGPSIGEITGELILAEPILACTPLINTDSLNGRIAIIDRGECKFIQKTLGAQEAGAIAVIICNNQNSLFTMSGDTTAEINIPAVLMAKNDCDIIKMQLESASLDGSLSITSSINKDSDLDNGVIIHEYGHGISIRLTGGAGNSSCLSNSEQMGEGWSDYFGLIMTMKPEDAANDAIGMATYLANQPSTGNGIRNYPYSTDMNINPFTYGDLDQVSVPHGVGSIWATMLWDMTWALIEEYGFDPDLYNGSGGNNIALQLVMTGLKLQPCNPGFVDGRDAILLADELIFQGANNCLIWHAFAKRGLGFNANQGDRNSVVDAIESFDLPPSCSSTLSYQYIADRTVVGEGDTVTFQSTILNNYPETISNLNYTDSLFQPFIYVENSLNNGLQNDSIIAFIANTSDSSDVFDITYKTTIDTMNNSYVDHFEDFEDRLTWSINSFEGNEIWEVVDTNAYWGQNSAFVDNVNTRQTQYLEKSVILPNQALLSFWHKYQTEEFWDGGFVQISTDNGSSWLDLHTDFLLNGYDGILINSSNPEIAGKYAFTGNSGGYQQSIINLQDYSDQFVKIRFVFGSDSAVSEDGWFIDGITIYSSTLAQKASYLNADNYDRISQLLNFYILPNCINCQPELDCQENQLNITNFDQNKYTAFQNISSSGKLEAQELLWFRAGQSIELQPNFEISPSAIFMAEYENCNEPE